MKLAVPAYLASFFLSILGNALAAVALPLIVLHQTGSVLGTGSVAAATAVPAILAGLFMGVVIDRFNRRDCSIVTDMISGLSIAALPLVDHLFGLTLFWFVLLGVIGSIGDLPGLAARSALLPAVLRESGMSAERMAGLSQVAKSLALLAGPALAGVLMAVLPGSLVLLITAAASLLAALTTFMIPRRIGAAPPRLAAGERGRSRGLRAMREGWRVVVNSPLLTAIFAIGTLSVMALATLQSLILPVHFTAIGRPSSLGFVLSAIALGTLSGGAIYAAAGRSGNRRRWLVTGLIGSAIGFAAIAALVSVPLVLIGGAIFGLFNALYSGLFAVLTIERVPDAARGRIAGIQNALMTGAMPLGILGAAGLIEVAGVQVAVAVVAAVWMAAVAIGLFSPALRDVTPERTPFADLADGRLAADPTAP